MAAAAVTLQQDMINEVLINLGLTCEPWVEVAS